MPGSRPVLASPQLRRRVRALLARTLLARRQDHLPLLAVAEELLRLLLREVVEGLVPRGDTVRKRPPNIRHPTKER